MTQSETLSTRLQRLRTESKMTQQQVADALGVTDGAVSHWELGGWKPAIYRIAALAKLYRTTTDYLLTGAEAEK